MLLRCRRCYCYYSVGPNVLYERRDVSPPSLPHRSPRRYNIIMYEYIMAPMIQYHHIVSVCEYIYNTTMCVGVCVCVCNRVYRLMVTTRRTFIRLFASRLLQYCFHYYSRVFLSFSKRPFRRRHLVIIARQMRPQNIMPACYYGYRWYR